MLLSVGTIQLSDILLKEDMYWSAKINSLRCRPHEAALLNISVDAWFLLLAISRILLHSVDYYVLQLDWWTLCRLVLFSAVEMIANY